VTDRLSRGQRDALDEVVVLDLVADPVPTIEAPVEHPIGGVHVLVDTVREIAANKLCASVGRSELRDLVDLRTLLDANVDLEGALVDSSGKDGGFSSLVLVWTLERFPLAKVARAEGSDDATIASLDAFRRDLVARLVRLTTPA